MKKNVHQLHRHRGSLHQQLFGELSFFFSIHTPCILAHCTSVKFNFAPIAGIKANKQSDKMGQWNNVRDHTVEVDRDQDRVRAQEERTVCTSADILKSNQKECSEKTELQQRAEKKEGKMNTDYSIVRLLHVPLRLHTKRVRTLVWLYLG